MRSTLSKLLHPLAGSPLLDHTLRAIEAIPAAFQASPISAPAPVMVQRPVVVIGYQAEQIEAVFGARCLYALQREQLGTGHALLAARATVEALDPQPETILVCYGDTPLIGGDVLARLLREHSERRATLTLLTATAEAESDFGRVVRASDGTVRAIVEAKHATDEQRAIREVNSGVYCFERAWLWPTLRDLPRAESGEYYLTDLVARAVAQGKVIASVSGPLDATIGINNRVQLADAEQLLRRRILEQHMLAGVTVRDPVSTYIDVDVTIGPDTVILPGTMITAGSSIGSNCEIGPGTTIDRSTVGDGCVIRNSVLEESVIEAEVHVGPFSHCRQHAHLARGVKLGNFAEVKNSFIGAGTDMHHFSYMGDATVGERANISAGVITCNFDGVSKHHTVIGDGAFVGCDTMLVAPVTVGDRAWTGAGSVVRKDVAPGDLVVGVPARVLRKVAPAVDPARESGTKE